MTTLNVNQPPDYYFKAYSNIFHPAHFMHKGRLDKLVAKVPANSEVLDAGCGSGLVPYLLRQKNHKVTGVDLLPANIEFARNKCPGAIFQIANITNFNLNKHFDVVICSDVLEHFKEADRLKVINNLDAHVKIRGKLLITIPSKFHLLVEKPWGILRKLIYPGIIFDDEDIHEELDVRELAGVLQNKGYTVSVTTFLGMITYIVADKK